MNRHAIVQIDVAPHEEAFVVSDRLPSSWTEITEPSDLTGAVPSRAFVRKQPQPVAAGILLPGWDCPRCRAFNGSARELLAECRCCGGLRPAD